MQTIAKIKGGQRVATMLMYLSDVVEGGETYFPLVSCEELSLSMFLFGECFSVKINYYLTHWKPN